jgi:subtilisin family serine protease
MNKLSISCIFLFIVLINEHLAAQERHYLIRLKNKNNTPYTIDNPQAFLSNKAITRRTQQGIAITEKDLPVNPDYITAVTAMGATVRCALKWTNSLLVKADESVYNGLLQLNFVDDVRQVKSPKPNNPGGEKPIKKGMQVFEEVQTTQGTASVDQNTMLGIDTMLSEGYNGAGLTIAVMDAGFRSVNLHTAFQHLFSSNRILGVWDLVANDGSVFEDHNHGAEVLSNIAANHPGELVSGGHGASFYLFRTETVAEEFELEPVLLARAVEMSDSLGVDIINISLGYNTFDNPTQDYTIAMLDGKTTISSRTLSEAAKKGMVVVTSAGNYGANVSWDGRITAPADADSILAVGAVNAQGERAGFSSTGPTADGRIKPDVAAQGVANKVANASTVDNYSFKNGTSFAAPCVAALVAGFWQAYPQLTAKEVVQIIKQSGSIAAQPNNMLGYGIPNYRRAKTLVGIKQLLQNAEPLTLYPNPAKEKSVVMQMPKGARKPEIQVYSNAGVKISNINIKTSKSAYTLDFGKIPVAPGVYTIILREGAQIWHGKWVYQP